MQFVFFIILFVSEYYYLSISIRGENMKKTLLATAILTGISLSITAFATALNLYEKPDSNSKVTASIDQGKQLIQIYHTEKKDWVKVANPQNGEIGWVKASDLKGPIIITQVNGSKIQQQILTTKDAKGKEPTVYSIIQYSGPNELKPEDAEKTIKNMEKRHEKMRDSMQKMHQEMQKSIQKMFEDFDKNFQTMSVFPEVNKIKK